MDPFITDHALLHINERERTHCTCREITKIVAERNYIDLGKIKDTSFRLAWDEKLGRCIILLVVYDKRFGNESVVSIWGQDFQIDHRLRQVTSELTGEARALFYKKQPATST